MVKTEHNQIDKLWSLLSQIQDPEIPVLTITELGIISKIEYQNATHIIHLTPTYSGCPAMDLIEMQMKALLDSHDLQYQIKHVISPPWTTDNLSELAKKKLKDYGIAPPQEKAGKHALLNENTGVQCPKCDSTHTTLISQFSGTSCKAMFRCKSCLEPFEYFKCH